MTSKKLNFETGLVVGAILLIGITVFVNRIVSDLSLGRLDLTEDKIYTVSQGARNILGRLDVPVQVKYYVTPKGEMPAGLKTLQQEVTDKLSDLEFASGGSLEYQVVDPTESPELEETLANKGIRPFQVQSFDRDALALKLVYSAISVGYKDEAETVLPQILPETLSNLEYELVSNVMKLTRDSDPVVAIYSTKEPLDPQLARMYLQAGQPVPEPPDNFAVIADLLREQGYDARTIALDKEQPVPEDAQALLVFAPRELSERQRYEISRVLRRGGSVIIGAQGTFYDYMPGTRGGYRITAQSQPLQINDLLSQYGVRIDDRMLMDKQLATLAIPRTQMFGGLRLQVSEPVQAPMQIRVMGDGIYRDLPLTAGVPEILYLWGNQVIVDEEGLAQKGLTYQPILAGSPTCWVLDRSSGALSPEDLEPDDHTLLDRPLLAVLIEGVFPDPWEGKETPEWPATQGEDDAANAEAAEEEASDEEAPEAGPEPAPEPGRLLVVGCSKMFEEMLLDQAGHSVFLLNSVDALTLGDDLISIRSKRLASRTFGEVSDGKKLVFRAINIGLIPVLVIIFGLGRRVRRRREKEEYMAVYARSEGGSSR
jgi:ABC-2 type transport system permease protein